MQAVKLSCSALTEKKNDVNTLPAHICMSLHTCTVRVFTLATVLCILAIRLAFESNILLDTRSWLTAWKISPLDICDTLIYEVVRNESKSWSLWVADAWMSDGAQASCSAGHQGKRNFFTTAFSKSVLVKFVATKPAGA